jgi:hypothetical protein
VLLLACRFHDPYEVEVAARIMRKWDDDDNPDTDAQDVADTVLKVWKAAATAACAPEWRSGAVKAEHGVMPA